MVKINVSDKLFASVKAGILNELCILDASSITVDDKLEIISNVGELVVAVDEVTIRRFSDIKEEYLSQLTDTYPDVGHESVKQVAVARFNVPKGITPIINQAGDNKKIKMYTDGGARGNPGPAASGYVLMTINEEIIEQRGIYLGIGTNNQAEYKALEFGLKSALLLGVKEIDVFMDSLLIVNQMKGIYKVKNAVLDTIHKEIRNLIADFDKVTFTHVPRALNKLADAEVNKALDAAANG